jgi:hypothetical protein
LGEATSRSVDQIAGSSPEDRKIYGFDSVPRATDEDWIRYLHVEQDRLLSINPTSCTMLKPEN